MNIQNKAFSLNELVDLTGFSKRTIRFYIQHGLVAKPEGAKRGSFYLHKHLEQLLEIKKWQDAGLSLERIKELLTNPHSAGALPPIKPRKPGSVEVKSHIYIHEGLELQIEPNEAGLSPEEVKEFIKGVMKLVKEIKSK